MWLNESVLIYTYCSSLHNGEKLNANTVQAPNSMVFIFCLAMYFCSAFSFTVFSLLVAYT